MVKFVTDLCSGSHKSIAEAKEDFRKLQLATFPKNKSLEQLISDYHQGKEGKEGKEGKKSAASSSSSKAPAVKAAKGSGKRSKGKK